MGSAVATSAEQQFRRLQYAQAAHAAGDALVAVSLAGTLFFSVPVGEARDRVGLYLLITMTPFALLAPVIGPLLDRWSGAYRVAIVFAAAGRAVLAMYMATRVDRLLLYPLAFGMLVLSRTHGVTRAALVPHALPEARTPMWGNARLSVTSIGAASLGGAVGAGLHRWLGPGATLRFAAVVFTGGAVCAAMLRGRSHVDPAERARSTRSPLPTDVLAGGAATAASRGALGFLAFFLAFALRQSGEGVRGFALVGIATGAGTLAGSLLAPALRALVRELPLLLGSLAAIAAGSLVIARHFDLRGAAIVAGIAGMFTATARLGFDSLVQTRAPEAVRARTFARFETIFQLCWVAGAGLATAIRFGAPSGLRATAAICAFGIAIALREALRHRPSTA